MPANISREVAMHRASSLQPRVSNLPPRASRLPLHSLLSLRRASLLLLRARRLQGKALATTRASMVATTPATILEVTQTSMVVTMPANIFKGVAMHRASRLQPAQGTPSAGQGFGDY